MPIHPLVPTRDRPPAATGGRDNLVALPHLVYRGVWLGIVGLHLGCATYLVVLTSLYWYIDQPYLDYYADLLAPDSSRHLHATGTIFGCVGILHIWSVVKLCAWSLYDGQLVLSKNDMTLLQTSLLHKQFQGVTRFFVPRQIFREMNPHMEPDYRQQQEQYSASPVVVLVVLRRVWSSLFSRHGIFGVDSEHFEPIFALRQLIEVVSQTYQAYRACQMISTAWLSRFYVVLTIVNCLSTPIFHGFLRTRPALGRLCCVIVDIVLNIGTSMLIPVIVFFPYYRAWDHEHYTFDIALLYNDVWFTNMIMENQLLFTVTGADFVTKLVPHLSIWLCLMNSRSLLTHKRSTRTKAKAHGVRTNRVGPNQNLLPPAISSVPAPTTMTTGESSSNDRTSSKKTHTIFVIAGVAICIIQFFAEWVNRSPPRGCMQSIRPWFATKPACSVFMYNCYRQDNSTTLSAEMKQLDASSMLLLVIAHCPLLSMPVELQTYNNLIGLEVFNSTILEWSRDNSISPAGHSNLVNIVLAYVNMTSLPDGILGPLPEMLQDIEIAYTNLTTLPDNLHELWHPVSVLYFEHSLVSEFPSTLKQLAVSDLSLIGNQIETIAIGPQDIPFAFYTVSLSGNPLRELPASLPDGTSFGFLALERCDLESLPDWIPDRVNELVYMGETPYCDARMVDENSEMPKVVTCSEEDPRGRGRYPMEMMQKRRPL